MAQHNARAWEFFRRIGSPKFIVAPMVDQSELAYRLLCRRHGAHMCYTPMFHARLFATDEKYRREQFTTCPEDRPLSVQFCGNDPQTILAAAKLVENDCDEVNLNLGCPQGIARRGRYGAFLLTETELLEDIVSTLHKNLKVPVTCKIRLLSTLEATIELAQRLEAAGCAILTVHGRTKEQKKLMTGAVDWHAIRAIKEAVGIPVIANGGIETLEDVERCLAVTTADGVMTSEAVLENPFIFEGINVSGESQDRAAREYLAICAESPETMPGLKCIRSHLFRFLFTGFQRPEFHLLRNDLGKSRTLEDMLVVAEQIAKGRQEEYGTALDTSSTSWYRRHQDAPSVAETTSTTPQEEEENDQDLTKQLTIFD